MDKFEDSATLAYVKYVLEELSMSPSALAKKVGVSSTTLTRPLNNSEYKFNLSSTTIEKIAAFSGISPGPFFQRSDSIALALSEKYTEEINKQDKVEDGAIKRSTPVVGEVALSRWKEISATDIKTEFSIFLSHSSYKNEDCFCLAVADQQAGHHAYVGDYLFCVRYDAYQHRMAPGCSVILERRRDDGRLVELTMRETQRVKAGWQLTTPARDRIMQHQVVLQELPGDDNAKVVGVVLYVIRGTW